MISTLVHGWADWMLSGPYTPRGLTEAVARQVLAPVLAELEAARADRERLKGELHRVMADLAEATEVAAIHREAAEQLRQERAEALGALERGGVTGRAVPAGILELLEQIDRQRRTWQAQVDAAQQGHRRAEGQLEQLRAELARIRPLIERGGR